MQSRARETQKKPEEMSPAVQDTEKDQWSRDQTYIEGKSSMTSSIVKQQLKICYPTDHESSLEPMNKKYRFYGKTPSYTHGKKYKKMYKFLSYNWINLVINWINLAIKIFKF